MPYFHKIGHSCQKTKLPGGDGSDHVSVKYTHLLVVIIRLSVGIPLNPHNKQTKNPQPIPIPI